MQNPGSDAGVFVLSAAPACGRWRADRSASAGRSFAQAQSAPRL